MDKKQKEALVLALLEKGETYRDIARKAGVSPNTINAIANKSGLDETPKTNPCIVDDGQTVVRIPNNTFSRWRCDPPYNAETARKMY